jgi:hypothetical protein
MKTNTEIKYPVFIEVSGFPTEQFWVVIFEDLAYGKCPYGTYFDGDTMICCRFKNKEFHYKFSNKPANIVHDELYSIFQDKLQLISKTEQSNKSIAFTKMLDDKNGKDWIDIKKKNVKTMLLENYVIDMTSKYELSALQMKKLLSIIMIGFQFKILLNNDVNYDIEKGIIIDIKGVSIKNNKIRLDNCIEVGLGLDASTDTENIIYMKDCWDKYLSQFE